MGTSIGPVQKDNRRVKKIKKHLDIVRGEMNSKFNFDDFDLLKSLMIRLSYQMDKQSAREARFIGVEWFAGVPSAE